MTVLKNILDMPSIIDQAKDNGWQCGMFDFGRAKTPDVDYFNSGIVDRPDGRWLVTRRSRQVKGKKKGEEAINDVMAFKLEGKTPQYGVPVNLERRFSHEHFEDPRVIYHDGKTFVSACNFVMDRHGWSGAHQIICEVNSDWQCVKRYDPVFGGNGLDAGMNTGHEKNWLWFVQKDVFHLLYSASPHKVGQFNYGLDVLNTTWFSETQWDSDSAWQTEYGEIRGGTPPVLVGDEYFTFFHSSIPWRNGRKVYLMGAYSFEAAASFRVKRIPLEPLLVGSTKDRYFEGKLPAVFACGALIENGVWTITGGCNDLDSFWLDLSHESLMERMVEV